MSDASRLCFYKWAIGTGRKDISTFLANIRPLEPFAMNVAALFIALEKDQAEDAAAYIHSLSEEEIADAICILCSEAEPKYSLALMYRKMLLKLLV